MNENMNQIKQKIKKLLALSKSPNEHEAASALQKANVLMEQYNLSADTMIADDVVCIKAFALKKISYRETVASAVSWLYSVYVIHESGKYFNSKERLNFYGSQLDAFMAAEMYTYLIRSIERMAKQNLRSNAKAAYRESYKVGLARNICERIIELGDKVSWAPEREHKRNALEKIVKNGSDVPIISKDIKLVKLSHSALAKGLNDGGQIQLSRQTTGSGGRAIEAQ